MKENIKQHLKSRLIGKRVFYFEKIDSTNLEAFRLINDQRAGFGDIIVAKTQSSGKGQQGNNWVSPEGNIYMSVITASKVSESSNLITFTSGISCAEAINSVTGISPKLKWVNDIIIDCKKLGGILTETVTRGNISTNVIGIGINVNSEISNAVNAKFSPVSLSELTHKKINTAELIAKICDRLEHNFDLYQKNPDKIVEKWQKYSDITGNKVDFTHNGSQLAGIITGINKQGFLRIDSGQNEYIITSTKYLTRYY